MCLGHMEVTVSAAAGQGAGTQAAAQARAAGARQAGPGAARLAPGSGDSGDEAGAGGHGREAGPVRLPNGCRARAVLERVGDKWSLYAIFALGDGTRRFTELRRSIDGVSQRMLTVTLRGLERDGIVSRTVYPVIPPRVEYALTPMGRTLLDAVGALIAWADSHLAEIETAREDYDRRLEANLPEAS